MSAWTSVAAIVLAVLGGAAGGCASAPVAAVDPMVSAIDLAIVRGEGFLCDAQQADGSWGTGLETRGTEVYSMVPGSHDAFRVATTALCVMALRDVIGRSCDASGRAVAAHEKGVRYLMHHGEARRDDGSLLYNTWAHTYALQCLSLEIGDGNGDPRLRTAAAWHLERLVRYQTHLGGWNYYDFKAHAQTPSLGPTSFGTAAGLVALWEARRAGVAVPEKLAELSAKRLAEMRLPDGGFLYGTDYKYVPRLPANRVRGSIGRAQAANDALELWEAVGSDEGQAVADLGRFFADHAWIEMGRKRPFPHESWYQTSGYYYYFGHYHAGRVIARLPEAQRRRFAPLLAGAILPHQEPDGSWWDYAMWDYHKPYGTAFAVMALVRVRDAAAGGGAAGGDAQPPRSALTK